MSQGRGGTAIRLGRRFAKIMHERSGGANGLGMCGQAEPFKTSDTKLFAEQTLAVAGAKDPFFQTRLGSFLRGICRAFGPPRMGRSEKPRLARKEEFARAQQLQFVAQFVLRIRPGKLGGPKLARGKIEIGQADRHACIAAGHRGQKAIFLGFQDIQVGGGAGGDDAHHFPPHQALAGAGLLHLITDGDLVTGAQQPGDVSFGGMKGDAAHGNGLAALAIARGESNLQFLRGHQGVFVEEFVEIAQTKQEQRVGIALLDRLILPHQRRRGFHHAGPTRRTILADDALGEQNRFEEIRPRSSQKSKDGDRD